MSDPKDPTEAEVNHATERAISAEFAAQIRMIMAFGPLVEFTRPGKEKPKRKGFFD